MGIMAGGGETTQFEEIIYDWDNSEILDKLYRYLDLDFDNEYDRKVRNAIENAVYDIVRRY